ncbi:hypothetical protein GOP47_0016199 [Adiantum capillus-veneris]|uniref:Uncharacterized protein n=1 Tax=Adiantum capillus-veneris TaxID=13818 RepID=A0A9D4ZAJ3_ADICA|nr:hypothetical protein GOP47_0016199 [Adiantum capillus-veneris]
MQPIVRWVRRKELFSLIFQEENVSDFEIRQTECRVEWWTRQVAWHVRAVASNLAGSSFTAPANVPNFPLSLCYEMCPATMCFRDPNKVSDNSGVTDQGM